VLSVSASPGNVGPGATLTLSMHLTDTTGVDYAWFQFRLDGATNDASWCNTTAQLTSGTAQDGVWTQTCTVPNVVNGGTYRATPYGRDTLGNWFNTNGGPTTDLRAVFSVS